MLGFPSCKRPRLIWLSMWSGRVRPLGLMVCVCWVRVSRRPINAWWRNVLSRNWCRDVVDEGRSLPKFRTSGTSMSNTTAWSRLFTDSVTASTLRVKVELHWVERGSIVVKPLAPPSPDRERCDHADEEEACYCNQGKDNTRGSFVLEERGILSSSCSAWSGASADIASCISTYKHCMGLSRNSSLVHSHRRIRGYSPDRHWFRRCRGRLWSLVSGL